MGTRKRYALVGTGGRAMMFIDAICDTHKQHAQLVGLCDLSPTRLRWHNARIGELYARAPVPTFTANKFDEMVRQARPDVVIVTTVDGTHHQYIARAMELGCEAICEKPMTIDAPKARAILDAIDRTGRSLRVTFNYRYQPHSTKMRELIAGGAIGRPLAVDFSWMLDTSHGADYFRRWHREKDKSGGLLVHKATHHFDLVNWWIDSHPRRVFAMGDLKFYGRANAEARGERYDYDRYTGHAAAKNDPFALFLDRESDESICASKSLKGLYLDAEADTGYVRDRNVFGDNITIEDTMAVMVRYRSGVIMNYSLIAYAPWEGFRVAITGDKGRVELFEQHSPKAQRSVHLFPMFAPDSREVEVQDLEGGHGGADPVMLRQIFDPTAPPDPLGRAASHLDGAASILVGISANESIRTGLPVECDELIRLHEKQPA